MGQLDALILKNKAETAAITQYMSVAAAGNIYTLDLSQKTNFKIETVADRNQVETATVVGTITTAGNATVVVTAAGMTGSPKTQSVAVALNDTASQVAAKIITALQADNAVTGLFTVGGTNANITLTKTVIANEDTTLNISIANGTCAGLTGSSTSANTTGACINKAIAFSNMSTEAGLCLAISVLLTYTNSASITHPTGTVWANGTPTFTVGKKYLLSYISFDNGTTWLGSSAGGW